MSKITKLLFIILQTVPNKTTEQKANLSAYIKINDIQKTYHRKMVF